MIRIELDRNWVDGNGSSPVDGGIVGFFKGDVVSFEFTSLSSVTEELFVLKFSPGGHEVVTNGEVLFGGVDFVKLGILGDIEVHSEVEFFFGGELETE